MAVRYLLDTDLCIGWLRRSPDAQVWLTSDRFSQAAICSVVKAELILGSLKSKHPARHRALSDFLEPLPSFPFDDSSAAIYARMRALLEKEGQVIGGNDLMIGSIALSRGLAVVTRNAREFARLPGLLVVEW